MIIRVRPLVAEEMTVFMTIALGLVYMSSEAVREPPAPPLMKRPVIRIIRVPATTIVKLVGANVLSLSFLYNLKTITIYLLDKSLHSGNYCLKR